MDVPSTSRSAMAPTQINGQPSTLRRLLSDEARAAEFRAPENGRPIGIARRPTEPERPVPVRSQRQSRQKGEVLDNYVDPSEFKQPRPVNPPIGLPRQPFKPPQSTSEQDKQIERLKIHMVGPKTKVAEEKAEEKVKRRLSGRINVGDEHQAIFGETSWQQPSRERLDKEPDRDQVMWRSDKNKLSSAELDDAWHAVRRHCGGQIGLDAMLHRLMVCHYDINEMLLYVEKELYENTPEMEPLSEGQRDEFEKYLKKKGSAACKKFRLMQDRFLKSHWLGEIVAYYYNTKHRGCPTEEYNLCTCRSSDSKEKPVISRVECTNCTRLIWKDRSAKVRLCPVCDLYTRRTGLDRRIVTPLTTAEKEFVLKWRDLQRAAGHEISMNAVRKEVEEERQRDVRLRWDDNEDILGKVPSAQKKQKMKLDDIAKQSKTKTVTLNDTCPLLCPQMQKIKNAILVEFTPQENLQIVKAIREYGQKWGTVACKVGKEPQEVEQFYHKYKAKYGLETIGQPLKESGHVQLNRKVPRSLSTSPDSGIFETGSRLSGGKRPASPAGSNGHAKQPRKSRPNVLAVDYTEFE
ncbi:unnamed protein product, partial [Mesorhabditis spiculigera]